jgi:hypothetical protein
MQTIFETLSKMVIAGGGVVPKALERIGFKPREKQNFFDEYQYVVRDLFIDLADGIILG